MDAIAKSLGVCKRTIGRDLHAVRSTPVKPEDEDGVWDVVTSHLAEVEEQARSIFTDPAKSPSAQIQALDVFRKTQGDRMRLAKEAGYFGQAPKRVEVAHSVSLERWTPEQRSRLADALIEATLTPQLPQPVPEEDYLDIQPTFSATENLS